MDCLDENTLSLYLDNEMTEVQRDRIDRHISECRDCLDLIVVAWDAQRFSKKLHLRKLNEKIKDKLGLKRRVTSEVKWFCAMLVLFVSSFLFKRYFLQFLVGASICGFKWAMEGEAARRVIMIFKGIDKKEKEFERKSRSCVSNMQGGDNYDKAK